MRNAVLLASLASLVSLVAGSGCIGCSLGGQSNRVYERNSEMLILCDNGGFAVIDAYSPCPTFNKVNTFKYYRDQAVDLPRDHDASDVQQAWARAASEDPVYLGVLYRADGEASFEEHIASAISGSEEDAPGVISAILDRYS